MNVACRRQCWHVHSTASGALVVHFRGFAAPVDTLRVACHPELTLLRQG
jgi:hypothetical protein